MTITEIEELRGKIETHPLVETWLDREGYRHLKSIDLPSIRQLVEAVDFLLSEVERLEGENPLRRYPETK